MFITAISVLILKNLKDSEKFFNVIGTNIDLVQTQITITNVNEEIMSFFKDKKDEDISSFLEQIPENIPFIISNNIKVIITIQEYKNDNLHYLNNMTSGYSKNNFLLNIDYANVFFDIVEEKKKILSKNKSNLNLISSKQQITSIIDEYIAKTRDTRILNIKDNFTHFPIPEDSNDTFISCKYDININNINSSVDMVFKVGDTNTTKAFSFNFRNKNE